MGARRGVAGTILPLALDALLGKELDGLRDATQEDTGGGRHDSCRTLRQAARRVPDGAGDGVAARPHLVVNLHRGQFPADAVVGAAHREARLGQRALVGGHAGGRLCKKNKKQTLQSCDTEPVQCHTGPRSLLCLQGRLSAVFVSRSSVKLGAEASRRTPSFTARAITELNKAMQRM